MTKVPNPRHQSTAFVVEHEERKQARDGVLRLTIARAIDQRPGTGHRSAS